ncbi:MAG: hypothetical protein JNK02_04775 [Planctomycetes bacterium]|nr:hypothetical protein [Planctomycetota bacterium]
MSQCRATRSWIHAAAYYGWALLIGLVTCKLFLGLHAPNWPDLADATWGVVEGHPRSTAFQSRLLGPHAVAGLSALGWAPESALRRFHVAGILGLFLLLARLLHLRGVAPGSALRHLATFALAFLGLQFYWFHTWDTLDLLVFSVLAYGIFARKPVRFFLVLYPLALLNRESGLFVAVYIALEGLEFDAARRRVRLVAPWRLWSGLALLALGIAWTAVARSTLIVATPEVSTGAPAFALGNELHVWANLRNLLWANFRGLQAVHSVFVIGVFASFALRAGRFTDAQLKAFLLALALFANILVFGIVVETRVFFVLLPLLLFLWVDLEPADRTPRAPAPPAA